MKTVVLNNESIVNSHGFILLNAGGDFSRFSRNPVMLKDHENETSNVLGRWENLRVSGTELLADPVFDKDDPDASIIAGKYERGFIRGASPGIRPIELQERVINGVMTPVVNKWELLEVSIVAIPSNAGAVVKLYNKAGSVVSWSEAKLSITDRETWTLLEWLKNDPAGLENMRVYRPAEYQKLKTRGNVRPENLAGSHDWTHLQWLKHAPNALAEIRANDPNKYQSILKKR